jgi:hypothetical protein
MEHAMTLERTRTLTAKQKIYVVERLAPYDALVEIAYGLKAQFGVDITPRWLRSICRECPAGSGSRRP